ncbi:ArnT family glycosyltransferase [Streptomyces sp. NPDC048362]|uniref:ArnT family glycosyltransferase n=1 Tax=Streptomyces sp. NPDC048362 TaxID=3365539 RepID=UPI0037239B30
MSARTLLERTLGLNFRSPDKPKMAFAHQKTIPRNRLHPSVLESAFFLSLLCVIALVQVRNEQNFPALQDDEGTYTAQAWAFLSGRGLTHYAYWYDHPPLGWIQIAIFMWVPHLTPDLLAVQAMRLTMLLPTLATAALIYLLARRLRLPWWAAGLATTAFGLSPLAVEFHRQVLLDNIAVTWMLLAFLLSTSRSRQLWFHFLAGMCAAISMLTKETMLVVVPAWLVSLWLCSHREIRRYSVPGAIAGCTLIVLCYPLLAALKGELLPGIGHDSLWDGIRWQLIRRAGSGSLFDSASDIRSTLRYWLNRDSVLPIGGLVSALVLLLSYRYSVHARALAGPALSIVLLVAVALRPGGYLPAMYVIQALPFLSLALAACAANAVKYLLQKRDNGLSRVLRRSIVTFLLLGSFAYVAPHWYRGDRTAVLANDNRPYRAAVAWMGHQIHGRRRVRVVTDDAIWLDLVRAGYRPGTGVIWFNKIDADPAIAKSLPRGWRDIQYVVSSPIMRRESLRYPTVRKALMHSAPVQVFGSGDNRVEIRRITHLRAMKP